MTKRLGVGNLRQTYGHHGVSATEIHGNRHGRLGNPEVDEVGRKRVVVLIAGAKPLPDLCLSGTI